MNQQTESYGQIGRLVVALVMVQLARGDSVEAEKTFREWGNCCEPEEVSTLQTLLQAFDDEDPELAARCWHPHSYDIWMLSTLFYLKTFHYLRVYRWRRRLATLLL